MTKFKYDSIDYFKNVQGEWERNGLPRARFINWMVQEGYELIDTIPDQITGTLTDTFELRSSLRREDRRVDLSPAVPFIARPAGHSVPFSDSI